MTKKELAGRLSAFMTGEAPRLKKLNAYYLGRHEILRAPRDPDLPDHRLVNNFPKAITDGTVGYFMGRGVTYDVPDADTRRRVAEIAASNGERFVNNALARDLSVFGRAAELLWYDDVGRPRFNPLRADGVFPIYGEGVDPQLLGAVRFFGEEGCDKIHVEYYDREAMTRYEYDGSTLTETARTPHLFGEVPVVFYQNNRDALGDFEPVLTLIDAYNRLESASVNDFELFADSYLAIAGMGGTDEEDLSKMKRDRVILLEDGGDAKWLTKTVNDTYVENLKNRIAKDIYRFSGTVDMAEETVNGQSLSGVAIRWRMLNFENRVSVTEQYFRRGLARRWHLVARLLSLSGIPFADGLVRPLFIRNIPGQPETAAELAEKLTGVLSRRTILEHLPQVADPEEELRRIEEEKEDPHAEG